MDTSLWLNGLPCLNKVLLLLYIAPYASWIFPPFHQQEKQIFLQIVMVAFREGIPWHPSSKETYSSDIYSVPSRQHNCYVRNWEKQQKDLKPTVWTAGKFHKKLHIPATDRHCEEEEDDNELKDTMKILFHDPTKSFSKTFELKDNLINWFLAICCVHLFHKTNIF